MVSTAMMASSTSRPSARISVPSETLCNPIWNRSMNSAVAASTSGMEITTTMPGAKSQAHQADHEHDADRLGHRLDEIIDRATHRLRHARHRTRA